MERQPITVRLENEQDTDVFGQDLSACLRPGDMVLLSGELGAGKTTLARSVIRAICDEPGLEVPSPTFTLVQTYDCRFVVTHADLYRLAAPGDIDELGLDEAQSSGIVLIEWPENAAGSLDSDTALTLRLDHDGDGRRATMSGRHEILERIGRSLAIRRFLADAGQGRARRRHLIGDASTRVYERISARDRAGMILMNAPEQPDGPPVRGGRPYSQIAHLAENVTAFVAIGSVLRDNGYCSPEIIAQDLEMGLLLLEDLGSEPFLRDGNLPITERYCTAARLLADMHEHDWPVEIRIDKNLVYEIPAYDRDAQLIETELLTDWYVPSVTGRELGDAERDAYRDAWNAVLDLTGDGETTLVLRDFHSPNLVWRANRQGFDKIGLLDFQDAVIGPAAYDVASLAQDARVTMPPELERTIVEEYCNARAGSASFDRQRFLRDYAIMTVQRNTKILGIFVRLNERDGKPAYLQHLPRIRDYIARSMTHEALTPLNACYARLGLTDR